MNKKKAIIKMLDGERVRNKHWDKYDFAYYHERDNMFYIYKDKTDTISGLSINGCNNEGWEIYNPKKTVYKYLWAYKDNNRWYLTREFLSEKEAFRRYEDVFILDYTRITVEGD